MPQSSFESDRHRNRRPSLDQNTFVVVSTSDFGNSLAKLLTGFGAEVIRSASCKAAQRALNQRHVDAVIAERYLGPNDPDGGPDLARWVKAQKRKAGSVEYPVMVIVAAWSPSFEERALHLGAILAEYDCHDILRRLKTALWMATSATNRLPSYEISYQSTTQTDRLEPGCLITSIEACWGRHRMDITPPSTESLLLLVYLLVRLNHPSNIEVIVDVHNNVEFYYGYLGTASHSTYKNLKMRYSRLKRFIASRLGKEKADRMLRSVSLEDDKSRAYVIAGSSLIFTCDVVPMKNRT